MQLNLNVSRWGRVMCGKGFLVAVFFLTSMASPVWAEKMETTAQEFNAMEPVCQAIGMGEVDGVFWAEALNRPNNKWILDKPENAMARGAVWLHHYCWGKLEKFRLYSAKTQDKRNYQIRRWRGEMEYIVNWTTQKNINWPYLPLIHKEIAESYLAEKNYGKAVSEAERALALDKDYAPAYIVQVDAYAELKNRAQALEVVTEGLKRNPDSRALKRRYVELGGKKPYPEPYPKLTTLPEPATLPTSPDRPDSVELIAPTQATVPEVDKTQAPAQPADNPHCRFCP